MPAAESVTAAGVLHVVATPIGNLGDLSPRAQQVLRGVDAGAVEVFVRPENIRFVAADAPGADGTILESTFLGSFRRTLVRMADGTLLTVQHPVAEQVAYEKKLMDARKAAGVIVMLRDLNSRQHHHYSQLVRRRPKDERFFYGWVLNRVVY